MIKPAVTNSVNYADFITIAPNLQYELKALHTSLLPMREPLQLELAGS